MFQDTKFEGEPEEYREYPEGSRQFWRFVGGEPVGEPTWVRDGVTFAEIYARRAEEPKRMVLKSVVISRLIEAGKIGAAKAALDANPAAFARWFASDHPAVNHDDPDAIALLKAIGADPDAILAP